MATRRALLIINRNCRQGGRDLSDVLRLLAERDIAAEPHYPRDTAQARDLIRSRARDFDLIILGGGDGTISRALPALLDSGLPLGVLPMGTANDLARTLGVPLDLNAAAALVADGHVHRIDLGRVNGNYFFNVANIGVGVQVTQLLSYDLKQRWGALAYPRALIEAIRLSRPFTARIDCDGSIHLLRSIQITVGNGRYYGGGMAVHAEAAIDDQRLDLYSIRPASAWRFLSMARAFRQGRHGEHPDVALLHGRRLRIETSRARMVTADGEIVSRTPALFEVVPAVLPVFVPEDASQTEGLRHAAQ